MLYILCRAEVGITFHHHRMKRTPNTLRGHVLLAAAPKRGAKHFIIISVQATIASA
jgi:predicted DsbA family dithiol-disulfide isomerase